MRQSGNLLKRSACESAEVRFVRFCTLSRAQLESWSVAEITDSRIYEGSQPAPGGPNDLRLGVNSMEFPCQTCGETRECQGHFGHIRLVEPVFHYGFMEYVEKILKCICHHCSKLKLFTTEQQSEKFRKITALANPEKRLRELAKLLAPIGQCPLEQESLRRGCGRFTPTKVSVRQHRILIEQRVEKNKYKQYCLSGKEVETIFSKITEEDANLLGFTKSRPVDLLISFLAVAPPQIRPSIEMNPEKKAEDDITITYARIVALNNEARNCTELAERNAKVGDMERLIASIMVAVDRITMSSVQSGGPGRKKRTHKIKSIEERLKSKEGRFRQHLMGKRVDFSARSVISPDANLALDELGVPEKIANSLTIPEEVTQWNFERIVELCRQGKVKFILRPSVERRRYDNFLHVGKLASSAVEVEKYLSYGTVVERNLEDGDYVLFNRQPTLHRMSMMAHRVKILPYNTFRLNLSVCSPYNADFDGDEMNMHVPQSLETIAELKHIAHVSKQVIAPKNNAPVMGIVQDSLLGIYLLTMRDTFLTREEIMNLVIWIEPCLKLGFGELPMPAVLKPEPMWTGKQVVSLLIPAQISITILKGKDGFKNKDDTSMVIRNGELISGALQKEVVGSGAGGLVHAIWLQLGAEATGQFITNAQRVANNWLMTSTFSVGAEDVIIDRELEERRAAEIANIKRIYYEIANKYRSVKYVREENLHQRGYKIGDSFEVKINMELNNALSNMQRIITEKVSAHKNNIYKMIVAKSKGSETNLAQIMLCLGNQNVDGRRCPLGFLRRALPHFSKDDNSPEPRGFVFSSFFRGLKPHEFFFHSMGGREGLSDTAVKTSSIGYIQRKLVKSLEDLSIRYDGTVRDSQSNLLQKLYGEDSFLAEFVERHRSTDCEASEGHFRARMCWDRHRLEEMGYSDREIKRINEEFEQLKRCRDRLRECFVSGRDSLEIEYFSPIRMERLFTKVLQRTRESEGEDERAGNPAGPLLIIENVEQLLEECIIPQTRAKYQELCRRHPDRSKNRRPFQDFEQDSGIEIFHIHLRLSLASKVLHQVHRFNTHQLKLLLEEIKSKFKQALAPAGEAVGSVAAQSIGEPTTQMTLNTFHLAGVSERNVTLGIPRLRELLDTSKRIKTPTMTIFYRARLLQAEREKAQVTNLLGELISFDFPERHIRDYLTKTRIYYDPNPEESNIGAPFSYDNKSSKSPWVMSLTFDKKKLTPQILSEIYKRLDREFETQFEITEKEGLAGESPEMILRCLDETSLQRPSGKASFDEHSIYKRLTAYEVQIKELFISGIKGLRAVKTAKRLIYRPQSRDELGKLRKEEHQEIVFETTGTNLRACLSHDKIDSRRTYSNDINEIYEVLGIEAARQAFLNEFKEILKPYSIYINHRHLTVLADWMTVRGTLTPINRNGINRVRDVSVLRKASFEETADVMFGAAVFSEIDELRGVSERIIFGETIKLGTNSFEVILDRERAKNPTYRFESDRVPIAEEANEDEPADKANLSKTPEGFNTPTRNSTYDFRSAYGSPSFPTGKTPIFTPTHELGFSSPQASGLGVGSPRYSMLFQSPKYLPTAVNPATRLAETPMYMPAGLNPFDSKKSSTPVAVFAGNNRPSDEPTYNSSPSYSPMVHPEDKPKKEEEEDN